MRSERRPPRQWPSPSRAPCASPPPSPAYLRQETSASSPILARGALHVVRATGAGGGGGGGALRRSGTPSSCAQPAGLRFRRAGDAAGELPLPRRRVPARLARQSFVIGLS